MAQLFGASWMCLLLAGLWSLACGYLLRRSWTAEADEANAAKLASSRNETIRLRTDVETRNGRVQALEAELAGQRQRLGEVEAAKAAEHEAMALKLSTFESKAAGFDLARVTSLKSIADRDRTIADLNQRLQAMEAAWAETRAQAERSSAASTKAQGDLVEARRAWDIERSTLVDEHGLKLSALDRSHAEAEKSHGAEMAGLLARVSGLAAFEAQARELGSQVASSQSALSAKEDALKSRDAELAALRARVADLQGWQAKFAQAEVEIGSLRHRTAELASWQTKFDGANAEIRSLRLRMAELEPWQGKCAQAEAELSRLQAQATDLQALQDQLRTITEQRDVAVRRRDEDLSRLSNELRGRIGTLEADIAEWRRRGEAADQQLAASREQTQALQRHIHEIESKPPKVIEKIVEVEKIIEVVKHAPGAAPLLAAAAAAVPERAAPARQRDDLKIIEGIGPKIEKLLHEAGYLSFNDVAAADPKALLLMLERAGPRFALARTDTWPQQARLLADNDMVAFKRLTDELKGGVRR